MSSSFLPTPMAAPLVREAEEAPLLTTTRAKHVLEAALVVAHAPLTLQDMRRLFDDVVGHDTLRSLLAELASEYAGRGFELLCIETGWRLQCRDEMLQYIERGKKEKAPRYSAAAMETLAAIAYRQPVTRADIEEARGIAVSSQVLQQFLERDWIEIIGHREGPGRPALYATTRKFLDDLGLESLSDLPIPEGLVSAPSLATPPPEGGDDESMFALASASDDAGAQQRLDGRSPPPAQA